ncbi:hypothetical protein DICPUDRAFT_81255 [Dictyostelium purpureum]|uniref:THH1/TOM1/TOM3 domain-containing protein n=1 Tax=Dictyostelium purpureum TaxID=5786 RepID=F0ZSY1_DICPU|nr:uncharacterized protein DICPUDRAFT_81255 [Dictyostelium purpureum]EGC32960.1 hypothetical protein DICPUDRAFT_81255 [Dictyostelium purpureum]|eukprot:XP_003290526.1 hypothetical protein DICPUDRAFT_81255 [Dictyostelium purpureum]
MAFEVISLIYFGNGSGLSKNIQLSFQSILALWHLILFITSLFLLRDKAKYTKLGRIVFIIIFIHSLAKTFSNLLFIICLEKPSNFIVITFDITELVSIITYYCMYDIVLFSWVEVIFRVQHLGYGERKVRIWRTVFCLFTAAFILSIFIISSFFVSKDPDTAEYVFGYGLISISTFSFGLSIAFLIYWIKLHRMVTSIPKNFGTNRNHFLGKSSIWDLYALNYLPEAIAVTAALIFFMSGSKNPANEENNKTETEKANKKRREKQSLLNNSNSNTETTLSSTISYDQSFSLNI